MHLQEPSTEEKVSHCATNKESIHSCNNHICSVRTFAPEHNLPVREKKIIRTTRILTWGKSRVLPTDSRFTLDILSSLYREKYMYTKSQRLFPTFLSGAKNFGHVHSLPAVCRACTSCQTLKQSVFCQIRFLKIETVLQSNSLRSRRLEVVGPKRTGARKVDTRGERECLPGRPTQIVSTRILWVRTFPIDREAPEGKSNRSGRENCQSILHGQRSEGLILHHQLQTLLNGIIEVQVFFCVGGFLWVYASVKKPCRRNSNSQLISPVASAKFRARYLGCQYS